MSDSDFEFSLDGEPRPWQLPEGAPRQVEARDLYLGKGDNPLEIAIATAANQPSAGDVKALWARRHRRRASPLLCVVLYRCATGPRAAVCGPTGEDPRAVLGLELGQTARVCNAALEEPNRHAASRFLAETLPEDDADLAGLRNVGMFATHHLRSGIPQRSDWIDACETGRALLDRHDRALVEALGYAVERRDATTSVLRADGAAAAIAVFLQDSENPDGPGKRYGGVSPATHALAVADRERLPYAVVTRGRQIRIYATGSDVGVGRKGRTETFIEANLAVLPDDAAGYLPLIFGAGALREGGSFEQILERSRDFATSLGERLRDRVYDHAVPELAAAVASRHESAGKPDLDHLYEQTLVILFRLLFVAYAEDKELLPYRSSGEYSRHALKTLARELGDRLSDGRQDFDSKATDLWAEVLQLFRAIEHGNTDWQVPRYNGSLFSSDPEISRAGAAISELELTNAEVGPVLAALLVDEVVEGTYGPVDFRSLSVREFGTIYEGLLESDLAVADQDLTVAADGTYVPASDDDTVDVSAEETYIHNRSGARKATGSYFTKPFAVEHLLDHALEPALDDHAARLEEHLREGNEAAAGEAFFDFRCADIAMGSGHFLVAAVDRIEARLSSFLAEHPVPAVIAELERLRKSAEAALGDLATGVEIEQSSLLRRQVARRCIYGVDRNLVAVELARLAIWIHTFVPGLPLGFLDRTLACGDSLTGIGTLDEAVAMLDPSADNNAPSLFRERIEDLLGRTTDALSRLARASDADAAEIRAARDALAEAEEAAEPARQLFDLLVAIRLDKAKPVEEIDEEVIAQAAADADVAAVAAELHSLHFPLVFPEVFLRDRPGFDCMLGNPPWEKLHVEEHAFWALRFPRLRSLPVGKMNTAIEALRSERSDLQQEYESEMELADLIRQVLLRGPYPDLGRSHPDLFKAFAWRFVQFMRNPGGRVGVVLPRGILTGAGSAQWRRCIVENGWLADLTTIVNSGQWMFDAVHSQTTVALFSLQSQQPSDSLSFRGPYGSFNAFMSRAPEDRLQVSTDEFLSWSDGATFPLLPERRSGDVFLKMRQHPRLDSSVQPFKIRAVQGDLNSTTGKKYMVMTPNQVANLWPVYSGKSFNLWEPDTGEYYAHADPKNILPVLLEKRRTSATHRKSAFFGLNEEILADARTLFCRRPRLVFRRITNRENMRTCIVCLAPPDVVATDGAPYLVFSDGGEVDEAFVLGVMSSIPFDWFVRRMVERHLDFHLLYPLPIPVGGAEQARHAIGFLAGQLACRDGRFEAWGSAVEVEVDALNAEARFDAVAELDARVAELYGLDRSDIVHVFETFKNGWDYSERLERVLAHYDDLN